ncbi:MAG: flavodoxin family protein [Planctomycetota bacterium]|nr:MAG: flavodoxin family protein [Planctomycetota bacterium]
MKNVFLLNAHQAYPFSEGKLNQSLMNQAKAHLESHGYSVQTTTMLEEYEEDAEIEKHQWADALILQSPVNWMGVPWSFKKYMDLVYTAGMDGRLCLGDGRSRKNPNQQYGSGGTLKGKRYMLSLTFNAPSEAFQDPKQDFFQGCSVDDLFLPAHLNFRFFGMEAMPTFSCHDVLKNPDLEKDIQRFGDHLKLHFPSLDPK